MTVNPASILVAIPTLNEERHIARTLDALLAGGTRMAGVTVVVADGGSTDRTREIVKTRAKRHRNLRLIDNPDRLQAAAVNRVVDLCAAPGHEILIRVDAHSRYPRNYVMSVAESLMSHGAAALATVMDSVGETGFQLGAALAMQSRLGTGGSAHRGGTCSGYVDHGHHAGFRLDMWRRVGGYDTRFPANEDAELDHRIARAGGRIWLDASIRLNYVMRPSLAGLARQYWRYGLGRARTVRLHRVRPRLRQLIPPLAVLANLTALSLAPVWPAALMIPLTYVLTLAFVSTQLALRHRRLCAAWAGPALLAMHHAWGLGFLCGLFRDPRA